jgi:hypothetical protein
VAVALVYVDVAVAVKLVAEWVLLVLVKLVPLVLVVLCVTLVDVIFIDVVLLVRMHVPQRMGQLWRVAAPKRSSTAHDCTMFAAAQSGLSGTPLQVGVVEVFVPVVDDKEVIVPLVVVVVFEVLVRQVSHRMGQSAVWAAEIGD